MWFREYLFCILLELLTFRCTQGIKCWVCDGKNSLAECHAQYGQMRECPNADDVCQNDYRTVRGKPLIIKGCKQARACETEVKQNKHENQCGKIRAKKNLVCRCCCASDGCNSKVSGCLPPPAPCKRIQSIPNGRVACPKDIIFGSACSFDCNSGYKMIGKKRAICQRISRSSKKGRWNPEELPFCEKMVVQCMPPRGDPENGKIVCKNAPSYKELEGFNYEGSVCTYSCDKNFYVQGKKISQCPSNGKWDNKPPVCTMGTCPKAQEDVNRIETCTNAYKFGSDCSFSCKDGFSLIGVEKSTCDQIGDGKEGQWTKRFPRCAKVICFPEPANPIHGKVACTEENFLDSVCTYTCDAGHDVDGTDHTSATSQCKDDGNGDTRGVWSSKPPTCTPITCKPVFANPQNGQVVCSDRNNYDSVCIFSCNAGYDLDGTEELNATSTCEDDYNGDSKGLWSADAATCSRITCKPEPIDPDNGKVACTDKGHMDSVCTYECGDDYDMEGTKDRTVTSTCKAEKKGVPDGTWTRPPPTCAPIMCEAQPFVTNGGRFCSMFNAMRGTFCVFYCYDGYDMVGTSYMSCQDLKRDGDDVGEWTKEPPYCELGSCSVPEYDIETVIQECKAPEGFPVNEYRVGTKCSYRCVDEGYYMIPNVGREVVLTGSTNVECNTDKKWTKQPPRCLAKVCLPELTSIENGHTPKCTNNNNYGSKCEFACTAKHGLTHERPLVCQADDDNDQYGQWSEPAPKCERNECDEFGSIMHGKLVCTNGVKIGSVCDLQCIDGYTTKKYEETECLPDAKWSRKKYVCCVKCLYNRNINIITLFDSPAFDTRADWQYMVDFIKTVVERMIRFGMRVQFSAFRYAEEVDTVNFVPKQRLHSDVLDDVADLIKAMPITGQVSNTGKALSYANEVQFATLDTRFENFVILVTSANTNDEAIESAKALRERGIDVLVVGVKINKSAIKTLLDIAGKERNVLTAETLADLRRIPEKIVQISMTSGCTTASRSQSCP